MSRPRMVHYWGPLHDRRVMAPCTGKYAPPEEWRVTGMVAKVTCKHCLDIIKREILH